LYFLDEKCGTQEVLLKVFASIFHAFGYQEAINGIGNVKVEHDWKAVSAYTCSKS
jgi:hypothetical protein